MTNLQYTHPRNYGKDSRHCRVCHTTRGLIRKYHLDMCRRCFRERATQIGFVKPLLAVAAEPDFYEQASKSSADFPLLVSQVHPPSNDSPGSKAIEIEIPSRSQLDALVFEGPSILLTHTRRANSLFALDGRAQIDGRGRANRPSGISITRGLPLTSHKVDPAFHYGDLAMDDRALKFKPEQLHMGARPTCAPMLWLVEIVNSARVGLRLDDVEFTRGGFEVLTNVQGIVLEPTGRLTVQFLFTPSFPDETYEAFMRVFTSSGQFALRITANIVLHEFGVTGIRAIVPVATEFDTTLVLRNPFNEVLRVLDVFSRDPIGTFSMPEGETAIAPPSRAQPGGPRTGAWDISPGERRRIVDYTFYSKHTGVFFTYIRIVTAYNQQQVAIPVVVEVVPEGLHFEPSEVHLGVLTTYDPLRQVDVHLFNAASVPIKIYSVHVDETATNMDIIVQMNGPIVIPPRTRICQAVYVHAAALAKQESDGQENDNVTECFATLYMKTNHSDVFNATMDIRGVWLKGTLAYDFNETLVGVVGSLYEAFNGGDSDASADYDDDDDEQAPPLDTRLLTMSTFMNDSIAGVHAGATVVRSLRLQNLYNVTLDLERVWVSPYRTSQGDSPLDIVHVDHFERGPAKSGEFWPGEIRLRVTPPRFDDLFAPRVVPVSIETNLMTHRMPVHLFYGFLQVKTKFRWLNHSQAGYQPASKPKGKKPLKKCLLVTDFDTNGNQQTEGSRSNNVKLCRSFVLEMGKVSAHDAHTKVLNLTNGNPIPVDIKVASMIKSELFDLSISSQLSKARQAAAEVAAIGRKYADQAARCPQMNIMASLRAYTNPKALNFKLHEDIVIPPGYDFTLKLGLRVGQELGAFTKYLLTLETPFEFLHVYARFESVTGAIRPLVTDVQLPPMFPGSTAFVDLHYQSTFAHDVPVHSVHVPRSLVQVVTTNAYIEARKTHSGFSFLFSPSYNDLCVKSKYLADCLLPDIAEPTLGITLSDFGDDASDEDMAQLGRRQRAWERIAANPSVTANVQLRTMIMETAAVRVTASLVQPSVTMRNASDGYAMLDFNLTKVLQRQARTVKVRNPSSISIDIELAVSRHDRALFYKCSEEEEEDEAGCLKEWEALVLQGARDAKQSVAPFFVSRRVVRVPFGQEAELGPVYFFPSHALEVDKVIFVRSELTHLEPVRLVARSGKGALDLRVIVEQQVRDIAAAGTKSAYAPYKWEVNSRDSKRDSGNPVVHFKMSFQSEPLNPVRPQQKDIELRNVGTYHLAVESVHLVYDRTAPLLRETFTVSIEDVEPSLQPPSPSPGRAAAAENPEGPIFVAPGKSIRLRVVYEPNCYIAHIEQELVLVVDDQTVRVPLLADVRPSASFDCLRAKVPMTIRNLMLLVWKMVVLWAAVVALYSVYYGLSDVWSVYCREMSLRATDDPLAAVNKTKANGLAATDTLEAPGLQHEKHEATYRLLDELEATCFSPDMRVVQTPAVTKLLHAREKKKNSSVAIKKQPKEDIATAVEPESVHRSLAPTPSHTAPVVPAVSKASPPLHLEQREKPTVVTSTPSGKSTPAAVSVAKPKPLAERVPSPAKPASPAAPVKTQLTSVEAVTGTTASQKTRAKTKAAKSKSLSPPSKKPLQEAEVPTPVTNTATSQSTSALELIAEPVAIVDDNAVRLERKAALKAKKAARPSRVTRLNQNRNAAARSPMYLSIAVEANSLNIDIPEPVDDLLASSKGSTSTTVSFDSEDLKLSPAETEPESAVDTDDFFLSTTFEAPFSSFGAIGKRRTVSPQPQQRGFSSDNQEDEDAVLVETFGLGGLNTTRATGTMNGFVMEPSALREVLDTVDDDDWSDLYFDSIRSEIGRLVAGVDSVTSNRSSGFGALHARPSGSDALAFNLQQPLERTNVVTSTLPAASSSVSTATTAAPATKKTPPGFTAADANPLESLAAFERLRSASHAPSASAAAASSSATATTTAPQAPAPTAIGSNTSSRFAFASRLSLFSPTLAQPSSSPPPFGLDQSGAAREANAATTSGSNALSRGVASAHDNWGSGAPLLRVQGSQLLPATIRSRNTLASLGGVELPSPSASAYTSALQ